MCTVYVNHIQSRTHLESKRCRLVCAHAMQLQVVQRLEALRAERGEEEAFEAKLLQEAKDLLGSAVEVMYA